VTGRRRGKRPFAPPARLRIQAHGANQAEPGDGAAGMTKKPLEEDVEFIKALAEVLRSHDLAEIEVNREYGEEDSLTIRIARHAAGQPAPVPLPPPAQAPVGPAPAVLAAPSPLPDPADDPGTVASPMVGTAYLQAEPGTAPFVKVGDPIAEGQTILIIEAMKTMNQIPAPRSGTVRRIFVEDGAPVEFGAPLMVIA
jgi:acetyl-CoA carboxylase biotin carboxyl carrier protein